MNSNPTQEILEKSISNPLNSKFNIQTNDYSELTDLLNSPDYCTSSIDAFLEYNYDMSNRQKILGILYTLVLYLDIEEKNYHLFAKVLLRFDVDYGYFNLIYKNCSIFRRRLSNLLIKNIEMFLDINVRKWYHTGKDSLDVVNTIVNRFLFEHEVLEHFYPTDIPDDVTKIMLEYGI